DLPGEPHPRLLPKRQIRPEQPGRVDECVPVDLPHPEELRVRQPRKRAEDAPLLRPGEAGVGPPHVVGPPPPPLPPPPRPRPPAAAPPPRGGAARSGGPPAPPASSVRAPASPRRAPPSPRWEGTPRSTGPPRRRAASPSPPRAVPGRRRGTRPRRAGGSG